MSGTDSVHGLLDWATSATRPGLYFCTLYLNGTWLDFWAVHDDFGNLLPVRS